MCSVAHVVAWLLERGVPVRQSRNHVAASFSNERISAIPRDFTIIVWSIKNPKRAADVLAEIAAKWRFVAP